jgi:hypothetical protein
MLELIRKAREATPQGLIMLDESEQGGRFVAIDENGEQWEMVDEPLPCELCEEDGTREGNTLTARDGWRHLITGAKVCSDCVGFTGDRFPLSEEELDALSEAARIGDTEGAERVVREARRRSYGCSI